MGNVVKGIPTKKNVNLLTRRLHINTITMYEARVTCFSEAMMCSQISSLDSVSIAVVCCCYDMRNAVVGL